MAWYLNPALSRFRAAVDVRYPDRSKKSDGTIGDEAHQQGNSDHNEDPDGSVDALDMDVELNGRGGRYAEEVEHLKRAFEAHESSRYWIHNDQIAERATGWKRRAYKPGDPSRNKHIKHIHWNTRESHERSTAPWNLEVEDMTPDQAQLLKDSHYVLAKGTRVGGKPVPMHVAVTALVEKVELVLNAVVDQDAVDVAELKAKLDKIDREATERAAAEEQREAEQHAELVALIEEGLSGERDVTEVLRMVGERLLTTPQS